VKLIVGGVALLIGARLVGALAADQRAAWPEVVDEPYAPAPASAPYVTLGYQELAADILWVRARGYFGNEGDTAAGLRGLVDALIALDPRFEDVYRFAALAIGRVDGGTTLDDRLWSLRVLDRGMAEFPDSYRLYELAGNIYLGDLETDDPAQRAAWDARGADLLERAVRLPNAPIGAAAQVAAIRTKLGQHERAVRDLRELILNTDEGAARQRLIEKLAELEARDTADLEAELQFHTERFERAWKAALPEAPAAMYILLGDPPTPYIDFAELAAEPPVFEEEPAFEAVTDE
jgi:hypothetical protein